MTGAGDLERHLSVVRAMAERVVADLAATTVVTDVDLGVGAWRVVAPDAWVDGAEPVDVVVTIDAPARTKSWKEYLVTLARHARKALLVFARNAERPGQGAAPDTVDLGEVLWRVGRVREHAYLGLPRLVTSSPVVEVPAGMLVRRTARLHAFVVDTAPRTPQARRRLELADPRSGGVVDPALRSGASFRVDDEDHRP